MNPLSLISPGLQVYARIAALVLLVAACSFASWHVKGAFDAKELGELKLEHANTVLAATQKSLAAQRKADADHAQLASDLASMSATAHENLTRSQHEIDILRPAVAAGTRVVRVAATCPAGPDAVPQAATGGRLDPAAGAVLDPAAGQAVLDLKRNILDTEAQLAACQQQVIRLTGQPRPSSSPAPERQP